MSSSSCFLTTDLDVPTLEQQQQVIHQINPGDVLLGRGKRALFWVGNVVFRKLCEAAAPSYQNASSGSGKSGEGRSKEAIVTNVIAEIHRAGGRFVREQDFVCRSDGMWRTVWLTVPSKVVRTKVKQACRDTVRNRHGRSGGRCCAGRINDDDDTNNMVSMTLSVTEPRLVHGSRTTAPDQALGRGQTSLKAPCGERPMTPRPDVEIQPEYAQTVAAPAAAATPNEPSDAELMAALLSMYEVFSSSSSSSSRRKSRRRQCAEPMTTVRHPQLPHDHIEHHHLPRRVSDDGLHEVPPPLLLLPPPSIDTAAATALATSAVPGEIPAYRCYDHPSLVPHTGFIASHDPSSFLQRSIGGTSCSVAPRCGASDVAAAAPVQGGCVSAAHHDDHDNTSLYSLLTLTPVERRLLAADPFAGFFFSPQGPPSVQDDQLHEAADRMCFDS
jgi:hypothetical protein